MKFEINRTAFDTFPELESDRARYRRITPDDAAALFEIRKNKEVMRFMDREEMKSLSESMDLIASIDESFRTGGGISWGIIEKSSDIFIGYFGFWRIDHRHCRGEIGYALHPNRWGKGYMQEAATTLLEYGFRTLHLHSVEANVSPENRSSIRLLEKTGFRREAYFRENFLFRKKFLDSIIYSMLERDLIRKQ